MIDLKKIEIETLTVLQMNLDNNVNGLWSFVEKCKSTENARKHNIQGVPMFKIQTQFSKFVALIVHYLQFSEIFYQILAFQNLTFSRTIFISLSNLL